MSNEVEAQRDYYLKTAEHYDDMHLGEIDEHGKAISAFISLAETLGPVVSVLDVGAGTGRAVQKLKARWPRANVIGIEPVEALREVGHQKGLAQTELINGTR